MISSWTTWAWRSAGRSRPDPHVRAELGSSSPPCKSVSALPIPQLQAEDDDEGGEQEPPLAEEDSQLHHARSRREGPMVVDYVGRFTLHTQTPSVPAQNGLGFKYAPMLLVGR